MSKLTEEQIAQETKARIAQALAHVQSAQNELLSACECLSALEYGVTAYKSASKLYDTVHKFWYRVEALRFNKKVRLDGMSIAAIERMSAQTRAES